MKYIKLFLINILAVVVVQCCYFGIAHITKEPLYKFDAYLFALVTPFVLFIVNFLMQKKKREAVHSSLLFILVGSIGGMFLNFALYGTPFQNGFPYDPKTDNESNALSAFLYKAVFFQCVVGSILYEWGLHKKKRSLSF